MASSSRWKKRHDGPRYTIYQHLDEPTRWSVRWTEPSAKSQKRRLIVAADLDAAVEQARILTGLTPPETHQAPAPPVGAAFVEAYRASNRGEKATHDWQYYMQRFMSWLAEAHQDISTWDQITRPILRQYLATLEGKSDTMRRLAIQPIRQTARYMEREHELPDRTAGLQTGQSPQRPPAEVYLADVFDLLGWIDVLPPEGCMWTAGRAQGARRITVATLRAGVALQALAGLRLQETTRLTWDRVDLDQGLIEISGDVKTAASVRVIPVCGLVIDALRPALHVDGNHSAVLTTPTGAPYGQNWQAYSRGLGVAIRQWNPRAGWKPKDLRNCLTTWAATNGYGGEIWEQYVGRAPRTIAGRHYIPRLASATRGESEELDRAMNVFRKLVIEPLETAIRTRGAAKIIDLAE